MVAQAAAGIMWPNLQGATNGDYQIKFLADRIVFAPYWYSQKMLSESHQPNVVGGFHHIFNESWGASRNGFHKTSAPHVVSTSGVAFVDWMAGAFVKCTCRFFGGGARLAVLRCTTCCACARNRQPSATTGAASC